MVCIPIYYKIRIVNKLHCSVLFVEVRLMSKFYHLWNWKKKVAEKISLLIYASLCLNAYFTTIMCCSVFKTLQRVIWKINFQAILWYWKHAYSTLEIRPKLALNSQEMSLYHWMRNFKNYTSRIKRKTTTWVFEHNTSAKQAITGISYGAPAAIRTNSVCADGVLITMVIVSSAFIKI